MDDESERWGSTLIGYMLVINFVIAVFLISMWSIQPDRPISEILGAIAKIAVSSIGGAFVISWIANRLKGGE